MFKFFFTALLALFSLISPALAGWDDFPPQCISQRDSFALEFGEKVFVGRYEKIRFTKTDEGQEPYFWNGSSWVAIGAYYKDSPKAFGPGMIIVFPRYIKETGKTHAALQFFGGKDCTFLGHTSYKPEERPSQVPLVLTNQNGVSIKEVSLPDLREGRFVLNANASMETKFQRIIEQKRGDFSNFIQNPWNIIMVVGGLLVLILAVPLYRIISSQILLRQNPELYQKQKEVREERLKRGLDAQGQAAKMPQSTFATIILAIFMLASAVVTGLGAYFFFEDKGEMMRLPLALLIGGVGGLALFYLHMKLRQLVVGAESLADGLVTWVFMGGLLIVPFTLVISTTLAVFLFIGGSAYKQEGQAALEQIRTAALDVRLSDESSVALVSLLRQIQSTSARNQASELSNNAVCGSGKGPLYSFWSSVDQDVSGALEAIGIISGTTKQIPLLQAVSTASERIEGLNESKMSTLKIKAAIEQEVDALRVRVRQSGEATSYVANIEQVIRQLKLPSADSFFNGWSACQKERTPVLQKTTAGFATSLEEALTNLRKVEGETQSVSVDDIDLSSPQEILFKYAPDYPMFVAIAIILDSLPLIISLLEMFEAAAYRKRTQKM